MHFKLMYFLKIKIEDEYSPSTHFNYYHFYLRFLKSLLTMLLLLELKQHYRLVYIIEIQDIFFHFGKIDFSIQFRIIFFLFSHLKNS